jgi:hypothetical protein
MMQTRELVCHKLDCQTLDCSIRIHWNFEADKLIQAQGPTSQIPLNVIIPQVWEFGPHAFKMGGKIGDTSRI